MPLSRRKASVLSPGMMLLVTTSSDTAGAFVLPTTNVHLRSSISSSSSSSTSLSRRIAFAPTPSNHGIASAGRRRGRLRPLDMSDDGYKGNGAGDDASQLWWMSSSSSLPPSSSSSSSPPPSPVVGDDGSNSWWMSSTPPPPPPPPPPPEGEVEEKKGIERNREAEDFEALRLAEEEAARLKAAEEEALRLAEVEAARLKAAEEEALRLADEEAARDKLRETEEALRLAEEESVRLKKEEEKALRLAEKRKSAEEAKLKEAEEALRLAEEEGLLTKEEEEEAARLKKEEEILRLAEEERVAEQAKLKQAEEALRQAEKELAAEEAWLQDAEKALKLAEDQLVAQEQKDASDEESCDEETLGEEICDVVTASQDALRSADEALLNATLASLVDKEGAVTDDKKALIRSTYLDWCKEYDKEPDESRIPAFSSNFLALEEFAKSSDIEMVFNEYADCTEEEYNAVMGSSLTQEEDTEEAKTAVKKTEKMEKTKKEDMVREKAAAVAADKEETEGTTEGLRIPGMYSDVEVEEKARRVGTSGDIVGVGGDEGKGEKAKKKEEVADEVSSDLQKAKAALAEGGDQGREKREVIAVERQPTILLKKAKATLAVSGDKGWKRVIPSEDVVAASVGGTLVGVAAGLALVARVDVGVEPYIPPLVLGATLGVITYAYAESSGIIGSIVRAVFGGPAKALSGERGEILPEDIVAAVVGGTTIGVLAGLALIPEMDIDIDSYLPPVVLGVALGAVSYAYAGEEGVVGWFVRTVFGSLVKPVTSIPFRVVDSVADAVDEIKAVPTKVKTGVDKTVKEIKGTVDKKVEKVVSVPLKKIDDVKTAAQRKQEETEQRRRPIPKTAKSKVTPETTKKSDDEFVFSEVTLKGIVEGIKETQDPTAVEAIQRGQSKARTDAVAQKAKRAADREAKKAAEAAKREEKQAQRAAEGQKKRDEAEQKRRAAAEAKAAAAQRRREAERKATAAAEKKRKQAEEARMAREKEQRAREAELARRKQEKAKKAAEAQKKREVERQNRQASQEEKMALALRMREEAEQRQRFIEKEQRAREAEMAKRKREEAQKAQQAAEAQKKREVERQKRKAAQQEKRLATFRMRDEAEQRRRQVAQKKEEVKEAQKAHEAAKTQIARGATKRVVAAKGKLRTVQKGSGSRTRRITPTKKSSGTKGVEQTDQAKPEKKPSKTEVPFSQALTAPRGGVPTIVDWEKRPDGSIGGKIFDSKDFENGDYIQTSPITKGLIENGNVVETGSGSRYFLADGGKLSLRTKMFFRNLGKMPFVARSETPLSPLPGLPSLDDWRENKDGSITGLVYGGSPSYADGDQITTSPIVKGKRERGKIVETGSGSKYFLM